MNTIIIHVNNRVVRTPLHDHYAALISPVDNLYLPPAPWWHWLEEDEFEDKGLWAIEEVEEEEEEYVERVECDDDDDVEDDVEDVDVDGDVEHVGVDVDVDGVAEYVVRVEALVDEEDVAVVRDLNRDDATLRSGIPFELAQKTGRDEWDEKRAVIVDLEPGDDEACECRLPDESDVYATDRGDHEIQSRRGGLATGDRRFEQDHGETGRYGRNGASDMSGSISEDLRLVSSLADVVSQQVQRAGNSWLVGSSGGVLRSNHHPMLLCDTMGSGVEDACSDQARCYSLFGMGGHAKPEPGFAEFGSTKAEYAFIICVAF